MTAVTSNTRWTCGGPGSSSNRKPSRDASALHLVTRWRPDESMNDSPPRSRTILRKPESQRRWSSCSTAPTVAMSSSPHGATITWSRSGVTLHVNGSLCCDNTCPPIEVTENKPGARLDSVTRSRRLSDRRARVRKPVSRNAILAPFAACGHFACDASGRRRPPAPRAAPSGRSACKWLGCRRGFRTCNRVLRYSFCSTHGTIPLLCPVCYVTMDTSGRIVSAVPLAGGHLALDFVNTVGGLRKEPPSPAEELLDSYEDVAIWCARLGVISERQADALRAAARRDEKTARGALRHARDLRDELLYPIFRALADGKEPPTKLLDRLRDEERAALADARLARGA